MTQPCNLYVEKKALGAKKKNKRDKSVFFNEEAKFYIFALEDLFWSMLDD